MVDDPSLAARLADDLEVHFEVLVRTFQDSLFGFTWRLTHSREDAEECTQDTFVRAYRALEGYSTMRRRDLRLRPWLYQIALNVVRNRARRATLPTLSSPEHLNGIASGGEDQPEARVLQSEQAADLEELLSKLPTRYSLAVVLRHVQGLSYAEVAEILDQPVGTTKSDVHRGLRLLRELLEPRLVADTRRS
jgi:RNA polymerase sigma-70 factor (ECF subfamily)